MEKRKEKGERRRIPEQEREMDRAIEKQEDWDEDRESGREVDRGVTKSKEGGREKKGGQREVDRAEEEEGESATQMLNTNRWGQSWTSVESKGLEGKLSQEVGGAVWGRRLVRIFFLSFKKKQQGPCSEEKNTLCNGQAVIIFKQASKLLKDIQTQLLKNNHSLLVSLNQLWREEILKWMPWKHPQHNWKSPEDGLCSSWLLFIRSAWTLCFFSLIKAKWLKFPLLQVHFPLHFTSFLNVISVYPSDLHSWMIKWMTDNKEDDSWGQHWM